MGRVREQKFDKIGEKAPFKRDGYAATSPDEAIVGTKPGLTRGPNGKGYSGPKVQKP